MAEGRAHIPVMLNEVVSALAPAAGETYVDGTFGAGGYAAAFLDAAPCAVIAIDRDPEAAGRAAVLREKYGDRFVFIQGRFGDAADLARRPADGFILDLGVSSPQLDEAERGFSFRFDGPLDMRMDTGSGITAAAIVNQYAEADLADLIYEYGEERHARRVARAIVAARKEKPIARTTELADIARRIVPRSRDGIDPATRTFQALRIAVNAELDELRRGLVAAERILRAGGRLVVVSFHSIEDGIVKNFMQQRAGKKEGVSRHLPAAQASPDPTFLLPRAKPVLPSDAECAANPRARSAKMRVAIRTEAESWGDAWA